MSDLKSRIKTIEKIATPKTPREIIPIMAKAWKVGDKVYYFDLKGQEQEFKQSEHKETPIFNFVASKEEAYREIEEWEKQEDKSLEAFINWRNKKRREELAKPATP
jgi:hypothetical protein